MERLTMPRNRTPATDEVIEFQNKIWTNEEDDKISAEWMKNT